MKKLVFATHNNNKLIELQKSLEGKFELISLTDLGCHEDIPETGDTLEENALIKARYVWEKYGLDCFADDTGLEIKSLNNEPGVYSARYAGVDKNAHANMDKVLKNMDEHTDRYAKFRTVIALIESGKEILFEGAVEGDILISKTGDQGFGYDPIFQPHGFQHSFAQMGLEQKNEISHRGRAVKKLIEYLDKN